MATNNNLGDFLTSVANAIRGKKGTVNTIPAQDFASEITNLPSPKAEEAQTLTPDFAGGNQVITPTSGKVLNQVTINKDTTNHIASNVKKDISLYGLTGSAFIAVENTQAQYDALATKDSNTYYLIVEES